MFFAASAAATFHPSPLTPSSVMQCVDDSSAANAHTAPIAVAIEPTPNAPTKRRVRVNTTRRSAPRSKRGVARLTTPVWMTVKWGPGGGRMPVFASSAPQSIAQTGPDSAPPTGVLLRW